MSSNEGFECGHGQAVPVAACAQTAEVNRADAAATTGPGGPRDPDPPLCDFQHPPDPHPAYAAVVHAGAAANGGRIATQPEACELRVEVQSRGQAMLVVQARGGTIQVLDPNGAVLYSAEAPW